MCGRFAVIFDNGYYGDFRLRENLSNSSLVSNYNAAPGQNLPVVVNSGKGNFIELMRWGLVPVWAKDSRIGYKMINAKSETLAEKPTWKRPYKSQRCIVPANGFVEWKLLDGKKQPFFIKLVDREKFAFAGIYDIWRDSEGYEHKTFSIITTEPNKQVAEIHNRMPVILTPEQEEIWLDPESNNNIELLSDLLSNTKDHKLDIYKIHPDINSTKNNRAELLNKI